MFTGIIEEVGTVERSGARAVIRCRTVLDGLKPGDSVDINGVCLTAVEIGAAWFVADVSPETLRRSNLGQLRPGSLVNLERALSASSRMGGHIVQGHIDTTGELVSVQSLGADNWWLTVRFPEEIAKYVVFKGSIAIDGMSLTVAEIKEDVLAATVLPHTYANTNLKTRRRGDTVNLEADVLAKYVERMLAAYAPARLTEARLKELGF